jgi:hypothetical protein
MTGAKQGDRELSMTSAHRTSGSVGSRVPYAAPRLEVLGDLRQLTLGGSGPLSESGGLRQFPPEAKGG